MRPTLSLQLVAAAAALALLAALALEHLGGYEPCTLCIWERYPYLAVLAAGTLGLGLKRPRLALAVAALALAANAALSAYHVGVEEGVFALPETCAAAGPAATLEELRAQILAAPARCDQVPLRVLGLSLAGWNGVLAALLAAVALLGLFRSPASAAEQDRHPGPAQHLPRRTP